MMWSYGMGWFGWTLMVAWWVFVVVGIVWLVRTVTVPSGDNDSARRLLDQASPALRALYPGEANLDPNATSNSNVSSASHSTGTGTSPTSCTQKQRVAGSGNHSGSRRNVQCLCHERR